MISGPWDSASRRGMGGEAQNAEVKSTGSEARELGRKPGRPHRCVSNLACHLASLCLSFLPCKVGSISTRWL